MTILARHQSKSREWYTPSVYVEAARAVMGGIDLDPASCEQANQTVQASLFFTEEDDGLAKAWRVDGRASRVFLNPPYGKLGNVSNQDIWSRKLVAEYVVGNVAQAILLVSAVTDTAWAQMLARYPHCDTAGRIKFFSPTGQKNQPTLGSRFVYFGPNVQTFYEQFSRFGVIEQSLGPTTLAWLNGQTNRLLLPVLLEQEKEGVDALRTTQK